jgi:hypothetical protein
MTASSRSSWKTDLVDVEEESKITLSGTSATLLATLYADGPTRSVSHQITLSMALGLSYHILSPGGAPETIAPRWWS